MMDLMWSGRTQLQDGAGGAALFVSFAAHPRVSPAAREFQRRF
ncbi:hypothetical protein DB31_1332 [Hyalangium minutum]|uniref:Uncharacterized protein n=1 Tax=Hyalangium minutum TaxID=394096 RepID=A0A085WF04_9BACT|nr:hypothetical protein DB31_1332 [Hyalangium minutum]